MKIEQIRIQNFRCFGPEITSLELESDVSCFIGNNGSGKTAVFQALSRLFGIGASQRRVLKEDFHIPNETQSLQSGTSMHLEVLLSFPELESDEAEDATGSVPEFFRQMAVPAPGSPLKARMALKATWTDDGTPEGNIDEELRWIQTMDEAFDWDECPRVQAAERGSIQLVYLPANRDATTQVTALLKSRLWKTGRWSDGFQTDSQNAAASIQSAFEKEAPTQFISERIDKRWKQVYEADTDTSPKLRLFENQFEQLVRNASFSFYPDESGRERALSSLSDGQRSLFHIALTAATLEAERDALSLDDSNCPFESEKLHRPHLTILAIEEPENSLSPFFLSRIMTLVREIGAISSAQVALSSHSPSILGRLEPEEIRYFHFERETRRSNVQRLQLPKGDEEASRFMRLAVKAYPELYFARFVVLGEGDSERLIIPRISQAMGLPLDQSFTPVVPLGGRYVRHFWSLLNNLRIPHATLIDLDLGRHHGGAATVKAIIKHLRLIGRDLSGNSFVKSGEIDLAKADDLIDEDFCDGFEENPWLCALAEEGVFFSSPLDVDFSMLCAFPEFYKKPKPGGTGPRSGSDAIRKQKAISLKASGKPELYESDYDDDFHWYPYLFLTRSKPETHALALSELNDQQLLDGSPIELVSLIKKVARTLDLEAIG